jgi:8-oxo-dGTP diphosphatase
MEQFLSCPECKARVKTFRNPAPTVDVVIFHPERGIVLIERKNPPPGWALPGGFVDYGETVESAALREAEEETGLRVVLTRLLGVYSDPDRDPRGHTMSVVFSAVTSEPDALKAGDDAGKAEFFPLDALPEPLAFDHGRIIGDFITGLKALNSK